MRLIRTKLALVGAAVVLAACGGSDGADYTRLVSFGDSLSDVGTYRVGTVAAVGGGEFTVNSADARNWTDWVAESIGVAAPCAAETGLLPNIPGFTGAAVTQHVECTNYAQGSARVSNPIGPNSVALQQPPFSSVTLGLMAKPVSQQIAAHLARNNGAFSGTELVTVMAGGNDTFMHLNGVSAAAAGGAGAAGAAIAAGWSTATQQAVAAGGAAAVQAAAQAAVAGMGAAGAELAVLVKTQIVAKGAKRVIVVNLPDVSQTPMALAQSADTRSLIVQMVTTFNSQLASGLAGTPQVIVVDAFARGRDQFANPGAYGIANTTTPACSTTSQANPLQGSSLACTAASTVAPDVSRYLFADSVHPTPYGYQLLGQYVAAHVANSGWE